MNLNSYLPLTETTFYTLLALSEPGHGYLIMKKIEVLSAGRVTIAAGTMYGTIDNLLKRKWIMQIPNGDSRKKTYVATSLGREILKQEIERLEFLVEVAKKWG